MDTGEGKRSFVIEDEWIRNDKFSTKSLVLLAEDAKENASREKREIFFPRVRSAKVASPLMGCSVEAWLINRWYPNLLFFAKQCADFFSY